jgi:ferric-dicitrate binding protein FerR (iron transport regulator)
MSDTRLSYLLKRHLSRKINQGESEELAALVLLAEEEELNTELLHCWQGYEGQFTLTEGMAADILANIVKEDTPAGRPVFRGNFLRRRWLGWAAAAVIVLSSAMAYYMYPAHKKMPVRDQAAGNNLSKNYIRNITLPDGSTVVLQAGSTLDFPAKFGDSSREVSLSGEAYFDIEHDNGRPFIIHTGTVSTTVLGTAFNIKAFSGQKKIVISVTYGKVKVEDAHRLLAVLTPDQQLNYQPSDAVSSQQNVDANKLVTDWTRQDMVFEESTFAEVAEVLKKRYAATIRFDNTDLLKCPIHASFKGTEKLENVLNVVCKVQGAIYRMNAGGTIVISGKGCNE